MKGTLVAEKSLTAVSFVGPIFLTFRKKKFPQLRFFSWSDFYAGSGFVM